MWMMTETKRTVLQSIKLNTFHICTPQCETWPTQSIQPNSVWNHSCQPKQATHLKSFYTFMTLYIMFEPGCFCRMAPEIISAWDYITEFYAFTQRISPQEETGTVWPPGRNRDLKKCSFAFENILAHLWPLLRPRKLFIRQEQTLLCLHVWVVILIFMRPGPKLRLLISHFNRKWVLDMTFHEVLAVSCRYTHL